MEWSSGGEDEGGDAEPGLVAGDLPLAWPVRASAKRYLQGTMSFNIRKQDKVFQAPERPELY